MADFNNTMTTVLVSVEENVGGNALPFAKIYYTIAVIIVRIVFTGVLAASAVVTNVINILVFYRQGLLSDSCTICLAGIALADLTMSLLTTWGTVLFIIATISRAYKNYNWDLFDFLNFTSERPKNAFTIIACWVTAFVAVERCVSVVFPFKVKQIFTPRRSFGAVVFFYVFTLSLEMVRFLGYVPKWVTGPNNVSKLVYVEMISDNKLTRGVSVTNSVAFRVLCIGTVIACNCIIFWKVKISKQFRSAKANQKTKESSVTSSTGNDTTKHTVDSDKVASKELKLQRMIMAVSLVFFFCYTPTTVLTIHATLYESSKIHPFVINIIIMCIFAWESVNNSVNIIIYYTMSSRFKEDTKKLFGCSKNH